MEGLTSRWSRLPEGLQSALSSSLIILKFVIPFYILSDVLLYFDLLRPLGLFLSPLTALLNLPVEAGPALIGGMFLNVYTSIAFAAPLHLSPHQWTVLGIYIGICHSLLVESAIMARLGISTVYAVTLRVLAALIAVVPLVLLGREGQGSGAVVQNSPEIATRHFDSFFSMLLHSATEALLLSAKVIVLVCALILLMDWIKSIPAVKAHIERVNTTFSILVGQLLGITYGAGILLREANRGSLSRRDIFFIGTFLMICHSSIEDILVFVLFGANFWIILGVRLVTALLLSWLLLRIFRGKALDYVMRK